MVEVKIKPSDIARLRPDMAAMVKITVYDFYCVWRVEGKVIDISLIQSRMIKESFYRVLVRTDSNSLYRDGKPLPIIPG